VAFSSSNTETVLLRIPREYDTFGDPIPGTGQDVPIEGCLFAPGPGREVEVYAAQVIADGTVFVPPEAPTITNRHRLVIRGEEYEVSARPRVWLNEATEVPVRIVTG
jgi:hypothetical protein